jgi:hypothetical protein
MYHKIIGDITAFKNGDRTLKIGDSYNIIKNTHSPGCLTWCALEKSKQGGQGYTQESLLKVVMNPLSNFHPRAWPSSFPLKFIFSLCYHSNENSTWFHVRIKYVFVINYELGESFPLNLKFLFCQVSVMILVHVRTTGAYKCEAPSSW